MTFEMSRSTCVTINLFNSSCIQNTDSGFCEANTTPVSGILQLALTQIGARHFEFKYLKDSTNDPGDAPHTVANQNRDVKTCAMSILLVVT